MSKHVLVTGASTGIGRACALHLARRGWMVHAGVRREGDGQTVERAAGSGVRAVVLDICDAASVASAGAELRVRAGADGLSGLVNNAGTCVAGPVESVSMGDWRRQFEVNFFGHIAVTQAMLPLLRAGAERAGSAAIVMMSSIAGRIGQPVLGPYCSSKFALEAVADALRCELMPQNIRVSILEPGAIKSEIWRKAIDDARAQADVPERYRVMVEAITKIAIEAERRAIPAERVAREVERCLTVSRPPVRKLIGLDAKMSAFMLRLTPRRVFDGLLTRMMAKAAKKM